MIKKKNIGYLAPQYYTNTECASDIPQVKEMLSEYAEKAKTVVQPCWYVKYAAVYFTYDGKYYCFGPGDLDTSSEIFEVLANEMIDRLYELGAYDMFYSGMLD